MTTARRVHYSYEDYLSALEMSAVKLEYCEGELYAMASGTPPHAELSATASALLLNASRGRYHVFSSDLKVRIEATDLSAFPDVTVVCGERQLSPIDRNAVTNPTLLVEITSHSTEDYDRGEKLSHYKQCPSVAAILIVSHQRPQVTLFERIGTTWEQRELRSGENVLVQQPALSLSVDELYAGIALEA